MEAFILQPQETRSVARYIGGDIRVLAGSEETAGELSVVEVVVQGEGPAMHVHDRRNELLFVLEGLLTIRVNDQTSELRPGAAAWIPHGVPHAFSNLANAPARILGICTPAGLEKSLTETADYLGGLPKGEHPDPARIAEISSRHDGGTVVGPPVR